MTKINGKLDLLDEDSALEAIETVGKLAQLNKIDWAIVGGIAMAFYGSPRLTKDVDIIATKLLPAASAEIVGQLQQGGECYKIQTNKKAVNVDWILRRDEAKHFFQAALKDAVLIGENNIPIITPEWLVILKYIANRFKDQEDAIYLLSEKDLVNRHKIKELVIKVAGKIAWVGFKAGLQRWYDLADGRIFAEKDGYIDS